MSLLSCLVVVVVVCEGSGGVVSDGGLGHYSVNVFMRAQVCVSVLQ